MLANIRRNERHSYGYRMSHRRCAARSWFLYRSMMKFWTATFERDILWTKWRFQPRLRMRWRIRSFGARLELRSIVRLRRSTMRSLGAECKAHPLVCQSMQLHSKCNIPAFSFVVIKIRKISRKKIRKRYIKKKRKELLHAYSLHELCI